MPLACCMVLSPSNSYRWMSQTYCISIKYVLYCWSNVGFNQLLYLCNLRRAQGYATQSPQNATDNLYLLYHYHIESLLELPDPKTYKCHSLVQRYHDHTNVIIISPIRLISQNLRHQERVPSLLGLCLACLKHSLKVLNSCLFKVSNQTLLLLSGGHIGYYKLCIYGGSQWH